MSETICPICGVQVGHNETLMATIDLPGYKQHRCSKKRLQARDRSLASDGHGSHREPSFLERLEAGFAMLNDGDD